MPETKLAPQSCRPVEGPNRRLVRWRTNDPRRDPCWPLAHPRDAGSAARQSFRRSSGASGPKDRARRGRRWGSIAGPGDPSTRCTNRSHTARCENAQPAPTSYASTAIVVCSGASFRAAVESQQSELDVSCLRTVLLKFKIQVACESVRVCRAFRVDEATQACKTPEVNRFSRSQSNVRRPGREPCGRNEERFDLVPSENP